MPESEGLESEAPHCSLCSQAYVCWEHFLHDFVETRITDAVGLVGYTVCQLSKGLNVVCEELPSVLFAQQLLGPALELRDAVDKTGHGPEQGKRHREK